MRYSFPRALAETGRTRAGVRPLPESTPHTAKSTGSGPVIALSALLATAIAFAASVAFTHVLFYGNDDYTVQAVLSGAASGSPTGYAVFPNILLCQPIAWLFEVAPALPWWFLALEAINVVALYLWCYAVIYWTARSSGAGAFRMRLGTGLLAACLSGWGLFALPISHPSFTLCAGQLAAVGAALFLVGCDAGNDLGGRPRRRSAFFFVASVIVIATACLLRFKSGLVGTAFIAVIALFRIAESRHAPGGPHVARNLHGASDLRDGIARGRIDLAPLAAFAILIAVVAAGWCANAYAYSLDGWPQFKATNAARSQYMDYPHASYADDPALYESVGWDEPLANLVGAWFFMDERVDGEAFALLAGTNSASKALARIKAQIASGTGSFGSRQFLMLVSTALALLCSVTAFCRASRCRLLLALAAFALSAAFVVYLMLIGRFVFRAAYSALAPAVAIMWLVMLNPKAHGRPARQASPGRLLLAALITAASVAVTCFLLAKTGIVEYAFLLAAFVPFGLLALAQSHTWGGARPNAIRAVLVAALMLACWLPNGLSTLHDANKADLENMQTNAEMADAIALALANPQDIYVYLPVKTPTDPFSSMPQNMVSWGDWSYYAPWKQAVFEQMGYPGGMRGSAFLGEGVYLVSPSRRMAELLEAYLNTASDVPVSAQVAARLPHGANVYRFAPSTRQAR